MELKFKKSICQSCGSPILKATDHGTEKGGENRSAIYCKLCYRLGGFTEPGMTADKMKIIIRHKMDQMKFPRYLADGLANRVYTLQRWDASAGSQNSTGLVKTVTS